MKSKADLKNGLNRIDFGARTYNPTIGRFDGVDPLAEKMPNWSPYCYSFDNPLRYIDIDGLAPLDIFTEGKDGRFTKISHQGGNRTHTYIRRNGDVSTYNVQTGTMTTVTSQDRQNMKASLAAYHAKAEKRVENTLKVLDVADKVGDVLSVAGTVAAPFTEGASLLLTAVGEGISLGATAAKHTIKLSSEGVTTENVVDFAVDAAFEVLPAQAEKAIENTGLDNVFKRILQAEIKQVSKTAEIITTQTVEHNREKNGQ